MCRPGRMRVLDRPLGRVRGCPRRHPDTRPPPLLAGSCSSLRWRPPLRPPSTRPLSTSPLTTCRCQCRQPEPPRSQATCPAACPPRRATQTVGAAPSPCAGPPSPTTRRPTRPRSTTRAWPPCPIRGNRSSRARWRPRHLSRPRRRCRRYRRYRRRATWAAARGLRAVAASCGSNSLSRQRQRRGAAFRPPTRPMGHLFTSGVAPQRRRPHCCIRGGAAAGG